MAPRNSLVEKMGYLLSCKDDLKKLKERAEELNNIKERINEANKTNEVEGWLKRFNQISEEAKKLHEEHESHPNARWGLCPAHNLNLKSMYQHGREAKILMGILEELEENIPLLSNLNYASEKLESRNSLKEDIVAALKHSSEAKLGIYGLPGVGKTHLALEVAEQVQKDKLFDPVIRITVTQPLNVEEVQHDIAKPLKIDLKEAPTVESKASRISDEMIRSKKSVLIILDDLWQRIELPKLGIPLPGDNYKGCKVLLISRTRRILEDNGTDRYFKVDLLNDEESRILFLIKATEDGVKDADLRSIAKQVVPRCEGLPLALVKMAQLCKDGDKEESMNLDSDYGKMKERICPSVERSYNKLEDTVKKVFLLCGVHGTPISIGDLLKYVIGLGVFGHKDSMDDTREKLKRTIADLKETSLLLHHSAREVEVNTLIYDVAALIASKHGPDHQVLFKRNASLPRQWPGNDVSRNCSQIILKCSLIQGLPARLDCPNLNFLYLDTTDNSNLKIPKSFFEGMKNLQVLDLIGMIMPSLPTSLVVLTELKTLSLRQCLLEDMTGIGALNSLEILSFLNSSISEMLDEIGQLTHLRMLDLSYSTIEVIPPNIISKLTQLEELYVGKIGISANQNIREILAKLGHLTKLATLELKIHHGDWILPYGDIFERLKRFNIVIGDEWEWSDSNGTSRLLKLKLHTSIVHLQAINTLIKRAEDLCLDEINGISNVLCELNDEGFPQIRKLHIQNNTNIQHVVKSRERNQTPAPNWFPNLETMILVNLRSLKNICNDPALITVGSFADLKVIKVQRCGQLEYLFPVSMFKQVSQLVEIEVYECSSMKTIVSLDSSSYTDPIEFSSLDSLTLHGLELNGLCSHAGPKTLNNPALFSNLKDPLTGLKHLKLNSVSLTVHLATSNISDSNAVVPLQNLETLEIEGCSELRYLFFIEGYYKMHESFCGLLPKIRGICLLKLGSFKSIVNRRYPNERILNFQRLNNLALRSCNQMKCILPLDVLKNLQQLQTIDVSDCNNLERLFRGESDKQMMEPNETMLPLLCSLKLANLPKLVGICSGDRRIISRSLTQMTAQNCPKFTFTFSDCLMRNKEKDRSDEQNTIEIIDPRLLENLNLGRLNQLKMLCKYPLVSFKHLTSLQLCECDKLGCLFPFAVARGLSSLQEIKIISCVNVEQILSRETEGKSSTNAAVEFPEVRTLVLENLPKLTGFCHGCTIRWLSLKRVRVVGCPEIRYSKLGTVDRPLLESVEVKRCLPWENEDLEFNILYLFHLTDATSKIVDLEIRKSTQLNKYLNMKLQNSSFRQLRSLKAAQCGTELSELVSILLRRSYKLEQLTVEKCEHLEQVFNLEGFLAGDQAHSRFPNLKIMRLFGLPELNCIWNGNPRGIVQLGNLVKLEIIECGLHRSPISSAVLQELVLLEELKIESCQMMEHVVEEDGELQNRVFPNLKILQLVSLQKLIKFNSRQCSFKFPNLLSLRIEKCPKMNEFTTGFLCKVTLTSKWTPDHVPHFCPKLRKLKLAGSETLEEMWQGWPSTRIRVNEIVNVEVDSLSNVRHIFCTDMLQSLKKLERVVVRNCSSLNYVFSQSVRDSIIAFEKLQIVRVHNCGSLRRLSIPSRCRYLREIEISNCDAFEEIFLDREEINTTADQKDFPYLQSIVLEDLPKLSYLSKEKFAFPSLRKVRIVKCPAMKTFCSKVSSPLDYFMEMDSLPDDKSVALEWMDLPHKELWEQEPGFRVWKNLTSLKIVRCRSIKKLFSISVANELAVLKLLELQECDSMVHALEDRGNSNKVLLQQLESLVLKDMPKLISFCDDEDVDFELPELKMVRVEKIPKMVRFGGCLETPKLNKVYATHITKSWKGDLNETIKYLNKNHDKFVANVWVTCKNPHEVHQLQ